MKIIKLLSIAVILFIGIILIRSLPGAGITREIEEISWGECEALPSAPGPEDLTIDRELELAFIASDDRRAYLTSGDAPTENGALWTLDVSSPNSEIQAIDVDIDFVFHPHGISLYQTPEGERYLYVVNHVTTEEHTVDVFKWLGDNKASLVERISFPEMISPNDLHVVGKQQFYITNDHGSPRNTVGEKLEAFGRLPFANILFYDAGEVSVAIDGLYYANGVILSPDQSRLFVSETSSRRISEFTRNPDTQNWEYKSSVDVGTLPDNLEFDEQGRLLTGAHPKVFDFLAHSMDADSIAPSEVIRVDINQESPEAEILYLNDGSQISASSVAAVYGNQMLIGGVFDDKIVRCIK